MPLQCGSADESYDVIVEGKDHQTDEHEDTDLLGAFLIFLAHRTAFQDFDQKEKNMPTIQYGDGQQVEQSQIDTQKRGQSNQLTETLFGLFTVYLKDHYRPANRIR